MTVKTDTYSQNVKMSFRLWVLSISNTHFSSECTAVLIYWCAVAFLVYREISSSVDCRCFCPAPDILGCLEAEMKDSAPQIITGLKITAIWWTMLSINCHIRTDAQFVSWITISPRSSTEVCLNKMYI